ncbi:MAG TPA: hypothetical protein VLF62_02070 [Candidatus Saccharimonadales bacterium]|nr:hypothetical protein [Candidatus Saccharimonadales bacterium]
MSTPEGAAELRYGDVIQLTNQNPSTPGITEGTLAVAYGPGETQSGLQAFLVTAGEDGTARIDPETPLNLPPAAHIRRFGRMTLWQMQGILGAGTELWEHHAVVARYANYKSNKQPPFTSEAIIHDETAPYLPEMRAEIDAVLEDIPEMNRRLADAGRPDLAMSERAEMQEVNTPEELRTKNNFTPNLMQTGLLNKDTPVTPDPYQQYLEWFHHDPPNDEMFDRLLSIAGLSAEAYRDALFVTNDEGHPTDTGPGMAGFSANDILGLVMTSHLNKKYFARMMVLFPTYTKRVLQDCVGRHPHDRPEDVLISAYQVMSKLVDLLDTDVMRDTEHDGVMRVDSWYLAR